ncbi:hypothetical protein ONE63_006757 [Megalurothrips usitatus]|uniref:C2H2-type domain-containing protein n=1 Tax=Megalurothrips usitatus TaxID=439358 RepID=A0AAV7XXG6_9NEOP|nr:hypothetical protein ONE63_006757 [Megalurothrips usitatus]
MKTDSVKANLETVFEKEDGKDEVGAPVETTPEDVETGDAAAPATEENDGSSEPSVDGEKPSEGSPAKAEGSPRKAGAEAVELDCKVCNCSFTNYQEHMNSDAHKAKISHSSPKTEAQGNTDKTGQAQKRSGDQEAAAPSPKRMKNQNQNAQNASTEKFHCEVCKLTMGKQQDYDHHMSGKRHLLNVTRAQGKAYCDICKLFFNSVTDLNDHTDSQLHKNNVAERKQDKQPFECEVCKITSYGQKQHDQHLTSKRHKKALERPAGTATTAVNGKVEPKPDQAGKKWLYLCNACNFGCNQDQEFSGHMILAEHKAAVIDMRKKGLVLEKGGANKNAAAAKPAAAKPLANRPMGQKPLMGVNAPQNQRKFQGNNVAGGPRNFNAPGGAANNAPKAGGPVSKVTYNIVSGPNATKNVPAPGPKPLPLKKAGPQGGMRKNMPPINPNMPVNNPPLSGRPNPRFPAQLNNDVQMNKFVPNAQAMKMGQQKMPFNEPVVNFGSANFGSSDLNNAGGNFGNYGGRPMGNFGANMRNDNVPVADNFRGSMRDDYRSDVRDIRDLRDIRSIDLGGDNRDAGFRSGFYREAGLGDAIRDVRGDYGNNFRSEANLDGRSDMRSGMGADARGDMRSAMTRNDMPRDVADMRSYGNTDMRDIRSDTRNDFRDRSTMSGFGGSAAYSQQVYRGNDDYRSDNYGRSAQSGVQATSTGNYSGGMAGGRYDYVDRSSSAYNNQYGGASRGIGYMGDMALNGR